jgi:lysophospholipase
MVNDRIRWRSHPKDASFHDWTAPDGMALRRMDWPAAKGGKARGSLLFAGGRGDFIEKYLETLAHWHDAGWNVTAFDWRGQGRSRGDTKSGDPDSFDVLVDDLAALIGDWREGAQRPHVAIGHSMGGHLLLRAIVERAPPLDAAILVAPMIGVNSGPIPARLAPAFADTMCRLGLAAQSMWKTPKALTRPGSQRQHLLTGSRERYEDELWWWGEAPGFNLGPPSWGWMRAAFRSAARTFTAERLGAVDLPILIMGTDRDRLVSPAEIRRAAAALPRAELIMYPDAAHEILREADPVRRDALARIDSFLDRHGR